MICCCQTAPIRRVRGLQSALLALQSANDNIRPTIRRPCRLVDAPISLNTYPGTHCSLLQRSRLAIVLRSKRSYASVVDVGHTQLRQTLRGVEVCQYRQQGSKLAVIRSARQHLSNRLASRAQVTFCLQPLPPKCSRCVFSPAGVHSSWQWTCRNSPRKARQRL